MTDRPHLSPLEIEPELEDRLEDLLDDARRFGRGLRDAMVQLPTEQADTLASVAVESTQKLFSKWNLEILYILAFSKKARFSDLKKRLGGISSRTLSNKLKDLEASNYVLRMVADERPLRVDYELTEEGFKIAALTTPLVAYINQSYARAKEAEATGNPAPATADDNAATA